LKNKPVGTASTSKLPFNANQADLTLANFPFSHPAISSGRMMKKIALATITAGLVATSSATASAFPSSDRSPLPNTSESPAVHPATYPGVQSIGGVRADSRPDHPSGHALDIMMGWDISLGDAIDADVESQASRFGVVYTMWRVADHFNHVHVTASAGRRQRPAARQELQYQRTISANGMFHSDTST
jgi:hypothetical protein